MAVEDDPELRYSSYDFPFARVFDEIGEQGSDGSVGPLESYLYFRRRQRELELTPCPDYYSTSITTGGHARRDDLTSMEVIRANTTTARQTMALMARQGSIDSRGAVLPVDLAYVPGWSQSDYMELWSLIISGVDIGLRPTNANATKFEEALRHAYDVCEVDIEKMNDKTLSATERAAEYFQFADAFADVVQGHHEGVRTPVRRLVSLVDPGISLGCQTERLLARYLMIPTHRIVAMAPAEIGSAVPNFALRNDIDTIISFGGTVVELADRPALTTLATT